MTTSAVAHQGRIERTATGQWVAWISGNGPRNPVPLNCATDQVKERFAEEHAAALGERHQHRPYRFEFKPVPAPYSGFIVQGVRR